MLYRTVKTDIWRDPWFVDLAPQSKCLFMYLFTNASVSACGAMEISLSQMAFDTKIPAKKLPAELERFGDKVLWLPEQNVIVVRNFYRHQRSQSSDNFTKAARKAMSDIPTEAQAWLGDVYPELKEGMDAPKDTHPQPLPIPSPTLGDKEEALAIAGAKALATGKASGEDLDRPAPKAKDYPDEFEAQFWEHYPKGRGSKADAFKLWSKLSGEERAAIVAAFPAFKASRDWREGFHSAPEVWLKGRRWENPPPLTEPVLPDGSTWQDVELARDKQRGNWLLTETEKRLLEIVDGRAAA